MTYTARTIRTVGLAGLVAALFLVSSCNPVGPPLPRAVYDTATVELVAPAGGSEAGLSARAIAQTASPEAIERIEYSVKGEDEYGTPRDPLATGELTRSGKNWTAAIPNLPLGPTLIFSLQAYDGTSLIYTGTTTTTLSESNLEVGIVLVPFDDGQALTFPAIRSIARPGEIPEGAEVEVRIELEGSADESLTVEIVGTSGSFSPQTPVDVPLSSGRGTLELTYLAPSRAGSYDHSVRVTNEQGNAVTQAFSTEVVWETVERTFRVDGTAPAIVGFEMSRTGSRLRVAASVTDDGPLSMLSYEWSFAEDPPPTGASIIDSTANPIVLQGYDETTSGAITLTITDRDTGADPEGLSTTVSMNLEPGAFSDELASEPPVVYFQPITRRATSSSASEFEPRLADDGYEAYVVYVERVVVSGPRFGPGAVLHQGYDGSTGDLHGPSEQADDGYSHAAQADASAEFIVYSEFLDIDSVEGSILVYDLEFEESHGILSEQAEVESPRIHGDHIVWTQREDGGTSVLYFNIGWIGSGRAPETIAGPIAVGSRPPATNLALGDRYIVWHELVDGQYDVRAYDLQTQEVLPVAVDPEVDESEPDTDGAWVTWTSEDLGSGATRIHASQPETGKYRQFGNAGSYNGNPAISGNNVVFESDASGYVHIYLYRIEEQDVREVTDRPSDQRLSDILGDWIAYTDTPDGNSDVFLTKMEFTTE